MAILKGNIVFNGKIRLVTGLHIGGDKSGLHIGGTDNPVIKTKDGLPYIPGSSLKGKMRCLLEQKYGLFNDNGQPAHKKDKKDSWILSALFGFAGNNKAFPGALIFRDCHLIIDAKKEDLLEIKPENSINRKTGTALNPRFSERVVLGTEFGFELVFREFEYSENECEGTVVTKEDLKNMLLDGLNLLEEDYLGGSGTRGYGRIRIDGIKEEIESKL